MKTIFSVLFLISSLSLFALPTAEVVKVRGIVDYQGQEVTKGMELSRKGLLKTGKKSFVKVFIKSWGNTIVLGPNAEMQLDLTKKEVEKKYSLYKGACRWVTSKKSKENKGKVYTKLASLGVRGTDYWLKVNHLLNETEIVVFDGKVEMTNLNDTDDNALLNKGQWGGIGGRFGNKLVKPIDLPSNVISHFNRYLNI